MKKDDIIINSIESYPNSFGVSYVGSDYLTIDLKGVKVNFNYKNFMRAEIILLNEKFEDCNFNPNLEQIKDKIIEVINS